MPSKFQTTVEMVAHTAKDITSHPETFMSFLETAANNYKYSLHCLSDKFSSSIASTISCFTVYA